MYVRTHIDFQDDIGPDAFGLFCQETGNWVRRGESWGTWHYQNCPAGQVICGLQTNVLDYQGIYADDVGLAEINLRCCDDGIYTEF